jgi:hypothetical protein
MDNRLQPEFGNIFMDVERPRRAGVNTARLTELIRRVAFNAYVYGEDTGDYSMCDAHHEEWFKAALAQLRLKENRHEQASI